jgi:type II secretory pathway component PulJ
MRLRGLRPSNRGFALIEVILSMGLLFAIFSLILGLFHDGWAGFHQEMGRLELNRAADRLVRDLRADIESARRVSFREEDRVLLLERPEGLVRYEPTRGGLTRRVFTRQGVRETSYGGGARLQTVRGLR